MSPILVRPVREQLEHDRVIRLLQAKYRRRYEAGMNVGADRLVPAGAGSSAVYPDLVLTSQERSRRLEAVVEVETGESVNHLEALAEWAHFGRLRAAFFLYIPSAMVEVARRLCEDNQVRVTEIWSFHAVGDDVRFALVHRNREAAPARPAPASKTGSVRKSRSAAPSKRPAARSKTAPTRGRSVKKPARLQKRK